MLENKVIEVSDSKDETTLRCLASYHHLKFIHFKNDIDSSNKAELYFNKAISINKTPENIVNYTLFLFECERYTDLIPVLKELLLDPSFQNDKTIIHFDKLEKDKLPTALITILNKETASFNIVELSFFLLINAFLEKKETEQAHSEFNKFLIWNQNNKSNFSEKMIGHLKVFFKEKPKPISFSNSFLKNLSMFSKKSNEYTELKKSRESGHMPFNHCS